MAAHTHVAVAVGIPVLHQAPGLGVYASLKESVKDRDFNGIKCFLQVVETHKMHCNPPECAHNPPFHMQIYLVGVNLHRRSIWVEKSCIVEKWFQRYPWRPKG